MHTTVRIRLSTMMFLQFFIWGSWNVTMGTYLISGLGFSGTESSAAYSTMNWGAIFAPIIVGMLADRFFSAQKVMAIFHLMGGAILWYISSITQATAFFWILLMYALCYMPTLALANAVAFNQMDDPGTQFPGIRVFGTLGWIVVGLIIGMAVPQLTGSAIEATNIPLKIGAISSLLMGLYAFTLPETPPRATGKASLSEVLGLNTLALMKDRSFGVFIIGSLLISIPLTFYYNFTNAFLNESGMEGAAAKMTLGQISETVFLILIPFFFVRLGVKKMLLVGMAAWTLRYIMFAFGNNEALVFMLYTGIILHGVCYDFFFVTGQIYVDKAVNQDIRASAQGFIHVATYGVGMVIGSWVSGTIVDSYLLPDGTHDWTNIWLWPAAMALVVMVGFILLFREPDKRRSD